MEEVGIGIVGAGQIAGVLARGVERSGRARIRAVCDAREEVAIKRALEWRADRCYTDLDGMLADPAVEAVLIATPTSLHGPMVAAVLQAGRHAATARPLALTLAEVDALGRLASAQRVRVGVIEPTQHFTPLMDAAAFVEGGEIGDVLSLRLRVIFGSPDGGWKIAPESWFWRFDAQQNGGGPFLFDYVYEGLVAATMLAGRVEWLQAWIEQTEIYPGYAVDAPATCVWRHASGGCTGSLELIYAPELHIRSEFYPVDTRLEVTGTRGHLQARLSPGRLAPGASLEMYREGRVFAFGDVDDRWERSFERAVEEFIATILDGGSLSCPPEIARQHLEATLAARAASERGEAQRLP